LQAELRFGWATLADLVRQTTLVACIVGLIVSGAGIVSLLAAQIPAGLAALILTVILVRGDVPLRPRAEPAVWRPLLRDTLPYAVAIAINAAYFRIAILFMSVVSSALATGYFAASFRIVEVIVAVPPVLMAAAFPILSRAARDDAERFAYASSRVFEVALLVGGLAVVGIELGAELAIRLLAGDGYGPSVPVLRIQAPAVLATFAAVACAYPLLSLRRNTQVLIANAAALVVAVVLLALLVAPFEERGAAVATLSAEVVLALVSAILLRRSHTGIRYPLKTLAWVLVAAGAAIAVPLVIGLPAVPQVVLGVLIYGAILLAAGRVPRELLDAARRRQPGT
jgi:O-antigen/teichoic acid export membrane protein